MNVIYFTNIYARNGWKWRLEIFTADVVPLSSPTYVDLGLAVVSDEITWAAKYNKLPIGLSETPSLKLKFNISALEDNTTLQHLRDRLFDQFVQYTFPTLSGISASIDVTDPVTGIVSQVVVYGTTPKPPAVKFANLSNVVRLTSNFGDATLDFADLKPPLTFAEYFGGGVSATHPIAFSGCQRIAPPAEITIDYENGAVVGEIEFMHLTRFVLEQINPTMVDAKIQELSAGTKVGYVTQNKWTGGRQRTMAELGNDDPNSKGTVMYSRTELQDAATAVYKQIRDAVLRADGWVGIPFDILGGLMFANFFQQNPSNGQRGGLLTGGLGDVYVIGRVYAPTVNEDGSVDTVAGMFSPGSKFFQFKNLFDFMVDVCECGARAYYTDVGIGIQSLAHNDNSFPTTTTITSNDIQLKKILKSGETLGGVELACAGENQLINNYGTSLVDNTFNVKPYFHNLFSDWIFGFENGGIGFAGEIEKQEGKLYYQASAGDFIAVHASCDFKDNAAYQVEANFNSAAFPPLNASDWDWNDIRDKFNEFYAYWRRTFGVIVRIGNAIMRNFANPSQAKIEGSTYPSNSIQALPSTIGSIYSFDSSVTPAFLNVPAKAILTSASMNVMDGTVDVEFICVSSPITVTLL